MTETPTASPETADTSTPLLSLLDLATVRTGQGVGEAIAQSVELAQVAEAQGLHRVWYAEHHNMERIASSATAVLIAHVAAQTSTIRVGSGGVMLPNHSPLVIAEQFGTLAELHPGRIDLGLGRAPGTDQRTLQALRRSPETAERFPQDVLELQGYLRGQSRVPGIAAYPGAGTDVPLYILGSSAFGAQLAARLGLGYAFASHFAPQMLEHAARLYREHFEPSDALDRPHFIAAANVIAADSPDAAQEQWELTRRERIRMMLGRGRTLTDDEVDMLLDSPAGQQVLGMLECSAVGTGPEVRTWLRDFADRVQADELIVTTAAPDQAARIRTLELLGEHVVRG
ncbi:LLM class flavin-dependent oxidoreductase [Micrococcus flavus]|uniref:Luciferase family oxidoreductase group 1 n=1 Tax=Micrococcus flavus TaxID=384602 RepID=A0A4Y8WVM6_9MICC|nr:LLM class flavin-dependent oxidoreductase [Micrococcus flavus]MBB4882498.1 luciferase family oxidoreductase group 1 [Micrococcus flavus]TFH99189.1 LLM class flavin-dependent oxidoreductase [Micrococcus flavus]